MLAPMAARHLLAMSENWTDDDYEDYHKFEGWYRYERPDFVYESVMYPRRAQLQQPSRQRFDELLRRQRGIIARAKARGVIRPFKAIA